MTPGSTTFVAQARRPGLSVAMAATLLLAVSSCGPAQPHANAAAAAGNDGEKASSATDETIVMESARTQLRELLGYADRGEVHGVLAAGILPPEIVHDVAVAPDQSFEADLFRFGAESGHVLLVAEGETAAGRAFTGEIWVRRKEGPEHAPLDLFLIDERKELAYAWLPIEVGRDWSQVSIEHTFEHSESDSSVALRIGNGYQDPQAMEVWIWSPRVYACDLDDGGQPAVGDVGDSRLDAQLDQLRVLTLRLADAGRQGGWSSRGTPPLPSQRAPERLADRLGQELVLLEHAALAATGRTEPMVPADAVAIERAVTGSSDSYAVEFSESAEVTNHAVEIVNTGDVAIRAPRVLTPGAPKWFDLPEVLAGFTSDSSDPEQLALRLWEFLVGARVHGDPASDREDLHDPVRMLNVFGYGFCDDAATVYALMAEELGLESRVWWLSGHVVPEVMIDGQWAMLDPDGETYYRDPASGRIAGVEQISADTELLLGPVLAPGRAQPVYPLSTLRPIFESRDDNEPMPPRRPERFHDMAMVLEPGDRVLLAWTSVSRRFANNRYVPPEGTANGLFRGTRTVGGQQVGGVVLNMPYAIVAARAAARDHVGSQSPATMMAGVGDAGMQVVDWIALEDGTWALPLTDVLPLGMADPAYELTLSQAQGSASPPASPPLPGLVLELELILQVAPASLPALRPGMNHVSWESKDPDARASIVHHVAVHP